MNFKYILILFIFSNLLFNQNSISQNPVFTDEESTVPTRILSKKDSFVYAITDLLIKVDEKQVNTLFDSLIIDKNLNDLIKNLKNINKYIHKDQLNLSLNYNHNRTSFQFSVHFNFIMIDFMFKSIPEGYMYPDQYKITAIQLFSSTPELENFAYPKDLLKIKSEGSLFYNLRTTELQDFEKVKELFYLCDSLYNINAISNFDFTRILEKLRLFEIATNLEITKWLKHNHTDNLIGLVERRMKIVNLIYTREIEKAKESYIYLDRLKKRQLENHIKELIQISNNDHLESDFMIIKNK